MAKDKKPDPLDRFGDEDLSFVKLTPIDPGDEPAPDPAPEPDPKPIVDPRAGE